MAKEPKKLDDLFHDTLKDIYFAEKKILATLPKMAKAAQSSELAAAFEKHRTETEGHVSRLEEVFSIIGEKPQGKTCAAIVGITDEGAEIMEEYQGSPALDAGLLAAAQAVEHYEISRYGTMRTWAEELGLDEAVSLLDATLEEEKATDEALTELAEVGGQPRGGIGRRAKGCLAVRLRDHALSLVLLGLFLLSFAGMAVSGWSSNNQSLTEHGQPELAFLKIPQQRRICLRHLRELGKRVPADGSLRGSDCFSRSAWVGKVAGPGRRREATEDVGRRALRLFAWNRLVRVVPPKLRPASQRQCSSGQFGSDIARSAARDARPSLDKRAILV